MDETIGKVITEYWEASGLDLVRALLATLLVLVLAKLARSLLSRFTVRVLRPRPGVRDYEQQLRRSQTLQPLLLEIERYVIYFIAFVTILSHFGVNMSAILASVGVVGIAVGFGAQNLVKDVISGFFLLFDGLIAVGDVIKVDANTSGTVEAVGLRNTQVREYSGLVWLIPNADLRRFGNWNRIWSRAVVPIDIAYDADTSRTAALLLEVGRSWAAENAAIVLEPPEVHSLMALGEAKATLRLVVKLQAMRHWAAERELRDRTKRRLEEAGIELGLPRGVVTEVRPDA